MAASRLNLHQVAADRALEFPGAELAHPFGPEWDVYKVCGKVFMLQSEVRDGSFTNLKSDPADAEALRASYRQITAGYHMNKRHWISVYDGADVDSEFMRELVTESYLQVLEQNVPKKRWPVDPAALRPCI